MIEKNRKLQSDLETLLKLRRDAVALKMVEDLSEVPENAYRPSLDKKRYALCQTLAMARLNRKTIFSEKADQWCWSPLISYGMTELKEDTPEFELAASVMGIEDREKARDFVRRFPKLPYGKYAGILLAPLSEADFEPDVILIYCKNYQLRSILMAVNYREGDMLKSGFTPYASCVYSVINPMLEGSYRITLPDPGEFERAHTPDDDIIFSVPKQKLEDFEHGVAYLLGRGRTVNAFYPLIKSDFERPPFYNKLFTSWGLDTGEDWEKR